MGLRFEKMRLDADFLNKQVNESGSDFFAFHPYSSYKLLKDSKVRSMTTNHSIGDIYRQFSHPLRTFIAAKVSNSHEADDILQDVFLKIHAGSSRLRDAEKLQSWIYQIARNAIIDHYRKRKKSDNLSVNLVAEDPAEESASEHISRCVRPMIEQLEEPYREALLLTEFQGMRQKELAERLGLSVSGAKSRVQRARKMLRDLLLACCHFEFDAYGTIVEYHPNSCQGCAGSRS